MERREKAVQDELQHMHVNKLLSGLPEDTNGVATNERAKLSHHVTAQLLFLAHQDRPNLRTAISFLTRRVEEEKTDEDDYKKLTRVAKYMRRTKFLRLILEATYLY